MEETTILRKRNKPESSIANPNHVDQSTQNDPGTYKKTPQLESTNLKVPRLRDRSLRKKTQWALNLHDYDHRQDSDDDAVWRKRQRKKNPTNKGKKKLKVAKKLSAKEKLLVWKGNPRYQLSAKTNTLPTQIYKVPCIPESNLDDFGSDIQGLFINIKWDLSNTGIGTTFQSFTRMKLPNKLLRSGIVFIWSEKSLLSRLHKFFESSGLRYIENVCICELLKPKEQNIREDVGFEEIRSSSKNDGKSQTKRNIFGQRLLQTNKSGSKPLLESRGKTHWFFLENNKFG